MTQFNLFEYTVLECIFAWGMQKWRTARVIWNILPSYQHSAWKWYTRAFTLLRNAFRRHKHGQQRR